MSHFKSKVNIFLVIIMYTHFCFYIFDNTAYFKQFFVANSEHARSFTFSRESYTISNPGNGFRFTIDAETIFVTFHSLAKFYLPVQTVNITPTENNSNNKYSEEFQAPNLVIARQIDTQSTKEQPILSTQCQSDVTAIFTAFSRPNSNNATDHRSMRRTFTETWPLRCEY